MHAAGSTSEPASAFCGPRSVNELGGNALQPAEKALDFAHGLGGVARQHQAVAAGGGGHVSAAVALYDVATEGVVPVHCDDDLGPPKRVGGPVRGQKNRNEP
jgi:hypothetical protein